MKDMTPQQKLAALAEKWRKESERRGEDANNKGWAHWVRENNAGRSIALHSCADELTTLLSEHGGGGEADPVAVVQSVGGVYGVKWLGETVAHGTYLYDRTPPPQPRADIRGHLPAPITNPKAWPPNYADGWNDCARLALDGVTIALAAAPCEPVSNDYKYDDCPKCRKRGDDCGEHFPPDDGETLRLLEARDDRLSQDAAALIRRLAATGQGVDDAAIEHAVRAHDREDAGQKGEPDPWADEFPEPYRSERMTAMRLAFKAAGDFAAMMQRGVATGQEPVREDKAHSAYLAGPFATQEKGNG